MALHLYVGSYRLSSWSLRPYLVLTHTGAAFETTVIALDEPTTHDEIAKVSPTGRIPVLHHDGALIWDSLAICEYLAEQFPSAVLWPVERLARARARAISAEMHAGFAALRREMPFAIAESRPGQGHTQEAMADVQRVLAIWREQRSAPLANEGPFLFGRFSIADAMFAPVATRLVTYGVELDPVCQRYVDAIYALPGLQQWKREADREVLAR
jgi:glutathione S-transferase